MSTALKMDAWLAEKGRNREWLAGQLSCSLSTLNRHLTKPQVNTFFLAVSKVTGMPLDELVPSAAPRRKAVAV